MCETGKTTTILINGESIEIDSCIADIVIALNQGGIVTIECCCGHNEYQGTIFLQDGRELEIINTLVSEDDSIEDMKEYIEEQGWKFSKE